MLPKKNPVAYRLSALVPALLSLALLLSVAGKARKLETFAAETATIDFVPWQIRHFLPLIIPLLELGVVVLIVFRSTRPLGMHIGALLLVVFTSYLLGRMRSAGDGCACFGGRIPVDLPAVWQNFIHILINSVLILLSALWLWSRPSGVSDRE